MVDLFRVLKTSAVISLQEVLNLVEIFLKISHKNRAGEDGVSNGLGDFGLAAARDGTRFVTQDPFGHRAHQSPGPALGGPEHANFIARGTNVGFAREQLDTALLGAARP